MTEDSSNKKIYTLSQLGESLKRTLEQVTHGRVMWFRAEIAKITKSPAGHVYLELVEEMNGQRLAMMRGTIWKSQHDRVREALGESADQVLAHGSEIVFSGSVNYHPVYGVSLSIDEIDLSAMIGEAERRKQATLQALKAEGALEKNSALPLPRLVQRIALVGSPGTSGFRDFGVHLLCNDWGLRFDIEVFAASVQGKDAPSSLIEALRQAVKWQPHAVVVVRGGGSALDLDAFNDLELSRFISNVDVPVLTGIGHETDLSVVDLVAHQHFKTPTAVADFLVDRLLNERSQLLEWSLAIGQKVQHRLTFERERFARDLQILKLQPRQVIASETTKLQHAREQLSSWAKQSLDRHFQRIAHLSDTVDALNPQNTMARGFSVVRKKNQVVRSASDLALNDLLELQFHQGEAEVRVTSLPSSHHE